MKAVALKTFRDKYTETLYVPGQVLTLERERFSEIREAIGDSYIAEIVDPEAVQKQETPDSGGVPELDNTGEAVLQPALMEGPVLSELAIGSLKLNPAFSPEITSYTAETSNNTNMVRAVSADAGALILVSMDGDVIPNGSSAVWHEGENRLTVSVALDGGGDRAYTVLVTKK